MAKATRRRLDVELMRRRLVDSRKRAVEVIEAGQVLVDGALANKASRLVAPSQDVRLQGPPPPFVSRGGEKLAAALDRFQIDPSGLRCLDAGSSTGGFTDCLVQRGAVSVFAVDVGTNQAHEKVRNHPRVTLREQTDIRSITLADVGSDPFDLVVGDLSFISLKLVLPVLVSVASAHAPLVLLTKPQFEAGRVEASKGRGIIRDPDIWRRVLHEVAESANGHGLTLSGLMVSPITGTKGNVEFLTRFDRGPSTLDSDGVVLQRQADLIERTISDAEARDR